MKGFIKRAICAVLAFTLFFGTSPVQAEKSDESLVVPKTANESENQTVSGEKSDYKSYLESHSAKNVNKNAKKVVISGLTPAQKSDNAKVVSDFNHSGKGGIVISDNDFASWKVTVAEDSLYIIQISYAAAKEGSGNLETVLKIDGEIPFKDASVFSFTRCFEQDLKTKKTSSSGDDIKPDVHEIFVWQNQALSDASGLMQTPYMFYFAKGEHTLSIEGYRGEIVIGDITLTTYKKPVSYQEYCSGFGKDDAKNANSIVVEAERYTTKNSVTVLPKSDRTSPATTPQSAKNLKINTLGGQNWKNNGEAVTWDLEVEKSGVYEIALRFRQNIKDGIFTARKLYIDGEVPFAEAEDIHFRYSSKWQSKKLGNDDGAFSFYLTKGKHTITLEAVAGETAEIIEAVSVSINELNRFYRRIVMITGPNPDTYRDYGFKNLIPDEIKEMKQIKTDLQNSVDYINKLAGANGSYVSIIQKIIVQLDKMTNDPRKIAGQLVRFKSNLGAMSEWLMTASEQPLEIDRITVLSAGKKTPSADCNFFKKLWFWIKSFFFSYFTDYNSIGASTDVGEKKKIKVWVQTGRDQAEIIRDMINRSFVQEYDADVDLEIVTGTLLQSVLAGISPDVVLDNAEGTPMDFALRNAVVDLREFDDFDEVAKRFSSAAIKPAEFDGKVYGLPQTFSFPMFFYRTDIFEEYGYTVPKTWKELCTLIPSLQRNRLEAGVPADGFSMFLYQYGGEFYREGGKACNLDDPLTLEAFADFTEMFTLYDCPRAFSFLNRFRTGEMPCAVQDYNTTYNSLTASAPEIKGLWEMVPIPGHEDENGNINNVAITSTSYIMMMKSSKNRDLAWEFMKWYMSTDVQVEYASRMESILGTCAKVPTANLEALSKMSWSRTEYENLSAQLMNLDAVPQVPGGYYLGRMTDFAFNRVYNNLEDPAETLTDYVKELNDELTRKRAEFGLE